MPLSLPTRLLPALLLVTLAACGVNGAPVAPGKTETPKPGVTVTGDARIGVVGRS